MISFILPVLMSTMPVAYQLDFGVLTAEPNGVHDYTVVLSFKSEPDVKIPVTIARKYGPQGAADFFVEVMADPRWKIKQNGSQVTVFGYDDVRVAKITVIGDDLKPFVRRVPNFPAKK